MVATTCFSSSFLLSSFFGSAGALVFAAVGPGVASPAALSDNAETNNSIEPILMRVFWTIPPIPASSVFAGDGRTSFPQGKSSHALRSQIDAPAQIGVYEKPMPHAKILQQSAFDRDALSRPCRNKAPTEHPARPGDTQLELVG